jgi:hypothetical protein
MKTEHDKAEEAYAEGIVPAGAESSHPADRHNVGQYISFKTETGKIIFGRIIDVKDLPICCWEAKITEVHPVGGITAEDNLAVDITSTIERIEKGISGESKALDNLLHRMAAAQSTV